MFAARLHGPRDIRAEKVPHPGAPGADEVLLRVTATGICGSDLHSYLDGRIGDTVLKTPLILGHEFAGVIEQAGLDALDGNGQPFQRGMRVAVDPAQPCHRCDLCERGDPNLCRRLHFCGLFPDSGSLCEFMVVPARTCFTVPDTLDDEAAAMLEPLGVALHATDLAKIRVGDRVAVVGAGPIGLLILQVVKLAGAAEIYVTDPLPWRVKLAEKFGAIPFEGTRSVASVRGTRPCRSVALRDLEVDIAIEAAWGADAIEQAVGLTRPGGRVLLVGIPSEDRCAFKHSTARRKGLTVVFSRRMKHVYPRAIQLVEQGKVDVRSLITHRFSLERATEAFTLNAAYKDKVVKVMIKHQERISR
jgi:L-iditol 2-dehydrogenase